MSFKLSIVNSKGDDMLEDPSKSSLRKFIRLLIGEAACQMNTAILFRSPSIIFKSVNSRQRAKHYAVPYLQGTTPEGHIVRSSYQ